MNRVSNISSKLKKTYSSNPETTENSSKRINNIINTALTKFNVNLLNGKVKLNSSLDLDRLVRLYLILSGLSVDGYSVNSENSESRPEFLEDKLSKIDKIIDKNDPTIQAIYKKLYDGYNKENDID